MHVILDSIQCMIDVAVGWLRGKYVAEKCCLPEHHDRHTSGDDSFFKALASYNAFLVEFFSVVSAHFFQFRPSLFILANMSLFTMLTTCKATGSPYDLGTPGYSTSVS